MIFTVLLAEHRNIIQAGGIADPVVLSFRHCQKSLYTTRIIPLGLQ
jgi:hypothetical protein